MEFVSLPLTCAKPVTPGVIEKIFSRSRLSTSSTSDARHGLGPMNAILPFNILNSCGNSSRLVNLKNRPNLVTYTAAFPAQEGIRGAQVDIVRSLIIVKLC
jgi:hypothetical protein